VLGLLAGIGLLRRKRWARMVASVVLATSAVVGAIYVTTTWITLAGIPLWDIQTFASAVWMSIGVVAYAMLVIALLTKLYGAACSAALSTVKPMLSDHGQ
jgi:hypothetical protein